MRQSRKEIKDSSVIIDLMNSCHVGRMGTIGEDGYPVIKPLNFAYRDGRIYFHSALKGEKIEDIRRDNRVCFEVDLPIAYVKGIESPCKSEYLYQSVIINGRAVIVEDREERISALRRLMKKCQFADAFGDFPAEKLSITCVVRIDI